MASQSRSEDPSELIRTEFRTSLEQFYSQLNLAPPYHSIEKAVQHLSNTLRAQPQDVQQLFQDPQKKFLLFQKVFLLSGLTKKHQGIIKHLAQSLPSNQLPQDSQIYLENFK